MLQSANAYQISFVLGKLGASLEKQSGLLLQLQDYINWSVVARKKKLRWRIEQDIDGLEYAQQRHVMKASMERLGKRVHIGRCLGEQRMEMSVEKRLARVDDAIDLDYKVSMATFRYFC